MVGRYHADDIAAQEKWTAVARQNGSLALLDAYRLLSGELRFDKREEEGRAIHLSPRNEALPVISMWPEESSEARGLYFGISVTNLAKRNINSVAALLPDDFEAHEVMHKKNEYRFGYIRDEATLREVMTRIRDRLEGTAA